MLAIALSLLFPCMDRKLTAIKGKEDLLKAFKRADGLQRVTALLANARSKKRVADIVLNEGLTILGAANGEIDLLRDDGSLSVFAHKGYPHEFVKRWPTILHTIPSDTPLLINEVLQGKKASFIDNTAALPNKYKVAKSFFSTTGTKSVAVLPMKIKGKVSGVIVFAFTTVQHFNKQEKIFMKTLTNQCAQALDRVIIHEELNASNRQLRKLDKKKDDFISMASHELKNPLTSMKLFLDLLSRQITTTNDKEKSLSYLYKAQEQAARLQRLISDLLDISRIQKGKLELMREVFRIDRLVEDTVEAIQLSTPTHTIKIVNTETLTVKGDTFRIYQVLSNFLTNARKYSPHNSVIEVSVIKKDEDALVSVTDYGAGISKEEQEHIFDKLFQLNNETRKTYTGLGMGLFISREIMAKHSGSIGVSSKKGKGSTFYFSLPLVKEKKLK